MSRQKFKILYPKDYHDLNKAGMKYKPPKDCMIMMNGSGVFFLCNLEPYYPSVQRLSKVLDKYDVVWEE